MANKTWLGTTDGTYTTAGNWKEGSAPGAGDDVRVSADAVNGIDGSDQSATAIGDFIVEDGFTLGIGSSGTDLKIDPNRFEYHGGGSNAAYIHLHSAAIAATVTNSPTASTGKRGLYLQGSALTTVSISGGSVGLASRHNESATITTVRVVGNKADVWCGEGLSLTTLDVLAGKARLRCAATTVNVDGGELTTEEEGAVTTMNVAAGTVTSNSTGTIGTLNINGGKVSFLESGQSRTVTTIKVNPGGSVSYDPGVMTLTTQSEADDPIRIATSKA